MAVIARCIRLSVNHARVGAPGAAGRRFASAAAAARPTSVAEALDLVNQHPVFVFAKSYCPHCHKAIKELGDVTNNAGVVGTMQLDNAGKLGQEVQAEIKAQFNHSTVPAVFVLGKFVGGASDVTAGIGSGSLTKTLKAAPELAHVWRA
ncbi:hypothetical protein FNF31_03764 [Cafeteria roenbergensis]|uniref:Glutaredoxin domain-containing protein n=1 Tax=Cafeteria roenbergensis TaxID=33653 RepID=A0A5A8DC55_CAFRO|nr:hypothetical protein FNF31_03764 [Cafeteria roenbergensis]KAA0163219.1 hypothetical protein FNF28_04369 [Cafeteria roenbergensis]